MVAVTGYLDAQRGFGCCRPGRSSAAALLVIVIGAFSLSGITFIKMLGIGMIVALVVDATVVRVLLVPATMRLLGRANWWAPPWLLGLYVRYGFAEGDSLPGSVRVREPEPLRM